MLSCVAKNGDGWSLEDIALTPEQKAEIDARLAYALNEE